VDIKLAFTGEPLRAVASGRPRSRRPDPQGL